jgi:hypothetical protein
VLGAGGAAVEEHGDPERLGGPASELVRERHAVVHRRARDGHERAHVERAHARVLALLRAHVDALAGHACAGERALDDRLGRADEGVDGAVGGGSRVDVEQRAAGRCADRVGDGVDHGPVTAFREVRHALDQLPQAAPPGSGQQ